MGHAIPVRMDYTAGEVRRLAQRAKDAAQARRLLAIAAVLDGASREEAAKIGGMDGQTLRDWRFRQQLHSKNSQINRCTNPEIKGTLLEGRVLAMVKEVMLDPAKLHECMDFFREDARGRAPAGKGGKGD